MNSRRLGKIFNDKFGVLRMSFDCLPCSNTTESISIASVRCKLFLLIKSCLSLDIHHKLYTLFVSFIQVQIVQKQNHNIFILSISVESSYD